MSSGDPTPWPLPRVQIMVVAELEGEEQRIQPLTLIGDGSGSGLQIFVTTPRFLANSEAETPTVIPSAAAPEQTLDPAERIGLDALAHLYAFDVDAELERRLELLEDEEGRARLLVDPGTPPDEPLALELVTHDDATLSDTEATEVLEASETRYQAMLQNVDESVAVRIGDADVSATRGLRLAAGERITLGGGIEAPLTTALYAIAESGTPSLAIVELLLTGAPEPPSGQVINVTVGQLGTNFYGYSAASGSWGSIDPGELNGQAIERILEIPSQDDDWQVWIAGALTQDFFERLIIQTDNGDLVLESSAATFQVLGGVRSEWRWDQPDPSKTWGTSVGQVRTATFE